MENSLLMERLHLVKGIDPVANAFAGTVTSDVIHLSHYDRVVFVMYKGVGAAGTTTVKVLACLDVTPSASSAVPFKYRRIASGDTEGTITDATAAAGFATSGASGEIYEIEVSADALVADGNGYEFVQLQMVELNAAAVVGAVFAIVGDARSLRSVKSTAIV